MSYKDRTGLLRNSEISGSPSSQDRYDIERNGEERFRVSTPTRHERTLAFNSTERLLPPDNQGHSTTFERNSSMDYGGYQYVGHPRQRPDTSVLLSDEVISGSLTSGNRMS